jgi:enediyne biosynthesis thioesterase
MTRGFDVEHLVTFEETNLVGNVYFVNHLRWQGECRERFLFEHAPAVIEALDDDLALVTTRCWCEYFAELSAFDRITVRMTLGAVRHNRIVMRFDYLRGGDELVARGEQEVACMARSRDGLRPVAVPPELLGALERYGPAVAQ